MTAVHMRDDSVFLCACVYVACVCKGCEYSSPAAARAMVMCCAASLALRMWVCAQGGWVVPSVQWRLPCVLLHLALELGVPVCPPHVAPPTPAAPPVDAAALRDESGASLLGWWVGRGEDDAVGHLLRITRDFGRLVGTVYTARDITDIGLVRLSLSWCPRRPTRWLLPGPTHQPPAARVEGGQRGLPSWLPQPGWEPAQVEAAPFCRLLAAGSCPGPSLPRAASNSRVSPLVPP